MHHPHSPQHAAPRTRPLWPWLAGLAAALFIAGTFGFAFWVTSDGVAGTPKAASADVTVEPVVRSTQLRLAYNMCGGGELADSDYTMIIDTEGEEYGSGTATVADVACILGELTAPESVIAQMEATRAFDGMQSAEWDGFEASWTYHPDAGLDLILTEND